MLEPGIYYGLDFQQYRELPYLNSSAIKWGLVSMKHLRCAVDGRLAQSDTEAKKLGRAVHARLLDPDLYASEFLVAQPCCAKVASGSRSGQECGAKSRAVHNGEWYCGRHAPADAIEPTEYISPDEAERIEEMASSLAEAGLVFAGGKSEVTVVADIQGVRMKARIDYLSSDRIRELKKSAAGAITLDDCEKSIWTYGWHIQAALYQRMVAAVTGAVLPFEWTFIEDGPPYDYQVVSADQETLDLANYQITLCLHDWTKAQSSGVYPGVGRGAIPGGLPAWARSRLADSFELREE